MLSRVAKLVLVATSLAPLLLVMAVENFVAAPQFTLTCFWFQLAAVSLLLVIIARGILYLAKRFGQRMPLQVVKARNSDKQILTFLLAYLLPILTQKKYLFGSFDFPTLAILAMLCVAVYHSNAFDFNPLLGMMGFHFYEVEGDDGFPYLLISGHVIRKPKGDFKVVQLFDYTFLAVE